MKNHLTIASVQMFATTKQETNLKTMEEYLIHINATFPQIDLVVFPELSSMSIGSKMAKQTQPIPGELTGIFASWAKKYGIWLHVDAAMAGPVALCPEYRHILDGLEYADSYSFNPHKWMLTSFDCSLFYVMDRAKLIQSLTIMPEYLKNANSQKEEVFDFRDWGIPLGRRFRALKLWHVINYYGLKGLQSFIREHMDNTQKLKSWIESDPRFEIVAPVPLTLICFRHVGGDKKTEALLNEINQSGHAHLTHTKLNDQYIIRFSVGQPTTTLEHLKKTWAFIQETAGEL